MEESMVTIANEAKENAQHKTKEISPYLKPVTEDEYMNEYWPRLQAALSQLLGCSVNGSTYLCYEQTYSCVYKCVCHKFSERLYQDLISFMSHCLEEYNTQLRSHVGDCKLYVEKFGEYLSLLINGLASTASLFSYMNKVYVVPKLGIDLSDDLKSLLIKLFLSHHVERVLDILCDATSKPFFLEPSLVSSVVRNLYLINAELAKLRPFLFSKYITNILPPSQPSDIDRYIHETLAMQQDLRTDASFVSNGSCRKRSFEDDSQGNMSSLVDYMKGDT